MANDVHTTTNNTTEPSMASLVTGIVSDVQDLVKQQVAMLRAELSSDFQRSREAIVPLLMGPVVCLMGGLVLCLALAHLLELLFQPDLPRWACYAIVGALISAVGGVLVYLGVSKFPNPLPDRTVATLEENVQWLTKRK
jgi:hypothetical protein